MKELDDIQRFVLAKMRPVREVFGFQRTLKMSIQRRWRYIQKGEPLNTLFMEDLRPGGREARLKRAKEKAEEEKQKYIYVSKFDAY